MTDRLEAARRELPAADRKVSADSAVGEVGAFKKSDSFWRHGPAAYDVEVPFGVSDDAFLQKPTIKQKRIRAVLPKLPKPPFRQFWQLATRDLLTNRYLTTIQQMRKRPSLRL
jgi:hypothetical protein